MKKKTFEYLADEKELAVIKSINKVLRLGNPFRGTQKYIYHNHSYVNCFCHACFNFSNDDIENFLSDCPTKIYGNFFIGTGEQTIKPTKQHMVDFIKSTGLKIEKCKKNTILKPNQYKVALFFAVSKHSPHRDFHFLRQEPNGQWTGKNGFRSNKVEIFETLPKTLPYTGNNPYKLNEVFVITNPYRTKTEEDKVKGE